MKSDREAVMIALTGTPLIGEYKTRDVFSSYIHSYYYNQSIADGYTLRLIREGIRTEYRLKLQAVLSHLEKQVVKGTLDKDKIYSHENYVSPLVEYIENDFEQSRERLGDDIIGAMIACDSSEQAKAICDKLTEHGKAAGVVPTGFLTASTGIVLKIRQHIVNQKILRGTVSMPSNIFANTETFFSVVFLNADGSDKALLVDASNLGTKQKIEGTKNQRTYLSDNEISRIIDTFNTRQEVEDFSVLVDLNEIAQKNFSFSAGQYFKIKIEYFDLSPEEFQEKMQSFQSDLRRFFDEGHQLERNILQQLEILAYEKN